MRKTRYFGSSNISNNTGHSRTCIFHMLVSSIKLPDVADQLRSQVACRFGHPEIVKLLLEAGTGRSGRCRCGDVEMQKCKAVVIPEEGSYESYGHDQIRSTSCFLDFTADGGLSVEASNGNPSSLAESPLDLSTSAVYRRKFRSQTSDNMER